MSDLSDRDKLIAASKRLPGERPLVTPCCKLTPELRDYQLHCPCGRKYAALAELQLEAPL